MNRSHIDVISWIWHQYDTIWADEPEKKFKNGKSLALGYGTFLGIIYFFKFVDTS